MRRYKRHLSGWLVGLALGSSGCWPGPAAAAVAAPDLWDVAKASATVHRFSTLFTAQDVQRYLSSPEGRDAAVQWCRQTGVTRVFVETFRDGYQAERSALVEARDHFRRLGFEVSGCVTPTKVGKSSTGWKDVISCYTDLPTQDRAQAIFEFAAGLFEEIMIDDFWFTDCACADCETARRSRRVAIGAAAYPVAGDTWEDYRCELMVRMSRDRVIAAARRVNPKARLILKYPQWYDRFHERGYEVVRQTADFDRIWVGTETRDYEDARWGGTVQYEAYFIMRWLGGIGGRKCGGGWYDWLGTTESTYLEQARQTILGGAAESLLFCYGGLQGTTGPANVAALRAHLPELLSVAREVRKRRPVGVAAYKPANSHPDDEPRIFDFVGMLGIPLVPCHEFPEKAEAAFFSVHALKDPALSVKLSRLIASRRPVLVTDGLAKRLKGEVNMDAFNVDVLPVGGDPKSVLKLPQATLDELRAPLLRPWKVSLNAPAGVALYLFKDRSWVLENFNSDPAGVRWLDEAQTIPARNWVYRWR
jgi:hypothetical protein